MASARRRKSTAVTAQLQAEPQRFAFFQAVRLLERAARLRAQKNESFAQVPVATGAPPNRESLHFRGQASLAFRGTDIDRVEIAKTANREDDEAPQKQWQMLVNIFSLFGSTGILPYHISELVIKRLRQKDKSLADFLDVLNHRSTSLYYQAWHKYRMPVVFERGRSEGRIEPDLFSQMLASLIGLGTARLNQRLPLPDEALMGYSAHMARGIPSAPSLARILQHYFELPIAVEQFIGQWQPLPTDMQSRMPGLGCPDGQNNELGMNVILGRRSWDIQSKFRIHIEHLNYDQFVSISPRSPKMAALKAFVRMLVGTEFDFDIEISIDQNQIPKTGLGQCATVNGTPIEGGELMLGWNCGLRQPDRVETAPQMIRVVVSE